jgi:hypothetical protein
MAIYSCTFCLVKNPVGISLSSGANIWSVSRLRDWITPIHFFGLDCFVNRLQNHSSYEESRRDFTRESAHILVRSSVLLLTGIKIYSRDIGHLHSISIGLPRLPVIYTALCAAMSLVVRGATSLKNEIGSVWCVRLMEREGDKIETIAANLFSMLTTL